MRYKIGQEVVINDVRGVIRRNRSFTDADRVRDNPAFDPNYESEQGRYSGPLWFPLNATVDAASDAADKESDRKIDPRNQQR